MRIDRCICTKRPFVELLARARDEGWSLAQLTAATGAGAHCGLCRPYLARGLRTGESTFHEILREAPATRGERS